MTIHNKRMYIEQQISDHHNVRGDVVMNNNDLLEFGNDHNDEETVHQNNSDIGSSARNSAPDNVSTIEEEV